MTTPKPHRSVNLVAVDQAVAEAAATQPYQQTVAAFRRAKAKIADAIDDGIRVDAMIWGGLGLHPTALKMQARVAAQKAREEGLLRPDLTDEDVWQIAELCARLSMLTFNAVAAQGDE